MAADTADHRPAPDIAVVVFGHCHIRHFFVQPSVVYSAAVVRIHHF